MKWLQKQRRGEESSSMDFPEQAVKFLLKNEGYWIQSIFGSLTSACATRRFGDKTMLEAFVRIDDSLKIMKSLNVIVVATIAIIWQKETMIQ